jgi:hypothetical protein
MFIAIAIVLIYILPYETYSKPLDTELTLLAIQIDGDKEEKQFLQNDNKSIC